MSTLTDIPQPAIQGRSAGRVGPRLTGAWQKAAVTVYAALFLISLISFGLSLASLNIWDRIPAAGLVRYFPMLDQAGIGARSLFQNEVLRMGFTLPAFAFLLTAFRLAGGLSLFILSAMIFRRYSHQLTAVLFAGLLTVLGAAGMWNNPLFGWASTLAWWMTVPTQLLGALLWFGVIVLYIFPDGQFSPRWTIGLAVLLVPLAISLAFELNIFLNPGNWPDPLPLLPNILFIGAAFYSVLHRYASTADPGRKMQLKGITLGLSLLIGLYFILFLMNDVYSTLTGQALIQSTQGVVIYILISEPLWYVSELLFVWGAARSIFRDRLLEE